MDETRLGAVEHRFNEVDHRFNRIEAILSDSRSRHSDELIAVNSRIDRLHRTIISVGGMVVGSVILSTAVLVAVQA